MANTPLEYAISVNEFNSPTVFKNKDAISQLLIHLILLEPGTITSKPKMGVGLISRYRGNSIDSLDQLKQDIQDQIELYLPDLSAVSVDVQLDSNNQLILNIDVDGVLYKYETSKQENNKIRLYELTI